MGMTTDLIRNIAFTGHSGTGKTTLVEQLLFTGSAISKPETVEHGKTVNDFTEEEIARKISIHASCSHIQWKNIKFNFIDTPGSSDFIGEVISAFRACESSVLLLSADAGVQIGTIRIWRRLNNQNMPRIIFINKMDKEHADFEKVLKDLKEKFKHTFIPLTIPIGSKAGFKGVVNLLNKKAYIHKEGAVPKEEDAPENMSEMIEKYRFALTETAAEGDDELTEKYLEQETLSSEDIVKGLKESLAQNRFVPVFCGAGLLNSGITTMLDILKDIAPVPEGDIEALNSNNEKITQPVKSDKPFSSFVFKTSIDQFSGKLSYLKIISGKLTPDSEIYNAKNGQKEKISKIFTSQGKQLEEVEELIAGDIGVITKADSAETGNSLCAQENQIQFPPIQFPQPSHSVAISAASKKDEDKLNQLLQREAEEDFTFQITFNKETKENVISAIGELQLNIILDKIKNKQKIDVETRIPKIAYRETITKPSAAEYQHKKQTGGHGQYAKVALEIQPIERGKYFNFVNAIFGGVISRGYIPGVEKGVLEGMENGILAGYPIVDIEAKVVDGKEHPVDSSELSFKLAARGALRAAVEKASPVLLEPVMNLEVYVDDKYLGDVLSDLSSRRGRVLGQEPMGGGIQIVKAQVPQAELLHYSIDLKSITSGTAYCEMEFDHYNPITGRIAEEVIKASAAEKEK